ncbi:MAG: aspartate kinase [Proteobacteria bacterium]|nr:aspartate kinase [Pseudomonadota bacterium]
MSAPLAPIVVMKFGGTSVGDVACIKHVADLVMQFKSENPGVGVVVVLSAMAGETNKLLALAKGCVEHPAPRELDVLLASGEQVTVALLAMRLSSIGIPAKSLLGSQLRIVTDERHTNAQIEEIDTEALHAALAAGLVPVVAGFQGVADSGDITTLGRGGSDITAVALAAALRAQCCFIYTDVTGVFSCDPRLSVKARLLERITHEEMLEMASLGAKVLHTRSVYFAMRYGVPLVVLSTFAGAFKPGVNGTWIVREEEGMEQVIVSGITHKLDEARLMIQSMPSDIETMSKLFSVLGERGVLVDMISQENIGPGLLNVSLTVADEQSSAALEVVREIIQALRAEGVTIERNIAKVSIVGIGMRHHTDVAGRFFRALGREGINVQMINTSEIKISVLVARKFCEAAVRVLNEEFIPG